MPDQTQPLVLSDFTGGRNSVDSTFSPYFRDNEAVDLRNVDFFQTAFAHKRYGVSASGMTFSSGGPFTGVISSLFRHVPGVVETAAEEWAVDSAATPVIGRKAGATTFTQPSRKDEPTGNGWDFSGASLNGKFFLAYLSAANRLHCWDSVNATIRRTGFSTPGAPTAANTGAGAYAAVLRYYRVRWTEQQSSVTVRRSEPGASVSFTPSGSGTHARVTQPTVASENETHWEVEASTDNVTFYLLATVVIGTTTYDDNAATTTYSSGTVSAATGTYGTQGSYKFIAADQSRLLGFGDTNTANRNNRVEFSAVVGSLNVGDAERVNTTVPYYIDLDENDSGDPTGLVGPVFGSFYAFKVKQFWELRPTGDVNRPYEKTAISKTVGAVSRNAYAIGEDAQGRPVLYFMSHKGMYRYGVGGLQYIGKGIEDLVVGNDFATGTNRINLVSNIPCHMVYHTDKSQLWVWWAVGDTIDGHIATKYPSMCAVYHTQYDCWTRYTGDVLDAARCSCMLSRVLGATMSRDLKPYYGTLTANQIFMADDQTVATDNGSNIQAYVLTRQYRPWGPGFKGRIHDALLSAAIGSGVTITIRARPNAASSTGLYTEGTAVLTTSATSTYTTRRVENLALEDIERFDLWIGEPAAATSAVWTLHECVVPWERAETAGEGIA